MSEGMSIYRCRKHGGIGFVSDCRKCRPAAPAPTEQPELWARIKPRLEYVEKSRTYCKLCERSVRAFSGATLIHSASCPYPELMQALVAAPTEPVTPVMGIPITEQIQRVTEPVMPKLSDTEVAEMLARHVLNERRPGKAGHSTSIEAVNRIARALAATRAATWEEAAQMIRAFMVCGTCGPDSHLACPDCDSHGTVARYSRAALNYLIGDIRRAGGAK